MTSALKHLLWYGLLALIVFYSVFPFYWAIVSSLKSGTELFSTSFWPAHPSLANYRAIFVEGDFGRSLLNSLFVATLSTAVALLLALGASYAFGRVSFRGRGVLLAMILSVSMFPQVAVLSGMFELVRALGVYNHPLGLVISYQAMILPFTIWVLTTYARAIPKELEEAAIMDGAGTLSLVFRIFAPLLLPALVTTGLLAFIAAWNEFLFALTFTLTDDKRTVPVAIALMSGNSEFELPWGRIMAASVLVTLPLVAMVLLFQRRIVAGLTAGAIKG